MRIQNYALRGQMLHLSAQADGRPAWEGRGDKDGFFDVPEEWGKWLLATTGWKAPPAPTPAAAPALLELPVPLQKRKMMPGPEPEKRSTVPAAGIAPPPGPGRKSVPPLELEADEPITQDEANTAGELADLGKIELLEWAQKNGIELSADQKRLKVSELRSLLVELSSQK